MRKESEYNTKENHQHTREERKRRKEQGGTTKTDRSLIRSHLFIFAFISFRRWIQKNIAAIYAKEYSACVLLQESRVWILFIYLFLFLKFIYFWLHWVFIGSRGLSLAAVSRGYSSWRCMSFSLRWLLLLRSTGSRRTGFSSCGTWAQQSWLMGSRAQAQQLLLHGLSCSAACGIFPDQVSNPCPLHWQVDS